MTFFSRAEVSVSGVIPYLTPSAVNSAFSSRQSLTACGIESPNCWIKSFKASKSLNDPLAALSKTVPIKTTVL